MVNTADYYPSSMDGRAAWHANWELNLPTLAAKYDIQAAALVTVDDDNKWIQFWVQQRHDEDARSQGLTKYFNTIAGKDLTAEPPAPITFTTPPKIPTEVPPGIEQRVRDIAKQIKGHLAYADADGELLGIIAPDSPVPDSPNGINTTFDLKTQAEFKLRADFKKKGNDGIRFEYRRIGGTWAPAGVLLTSGGRFTIPPTDPGVAEQVEVRGIYIKGNEDVGNFSPAVPAFIAP